MWKSRAAGKGGGRAAGSLLNGLKEMHHDPIRRFVAGENLRVRVYLAVE
jgi:hypothetical protein